ncbi:cyclin-dependent kinase 5 activator 1-like [Astyanax mexicanus]|uniref:cyclin-dependent kinase 5 activator 1-like n=1 Tax=Astyanax mexicanus TaxID=7994 RepID=UPI0020CAD2F8|nr:cyclin-dependent kinase 5 activator 1-like [Astyanax mexicanus]
MMDGVCARTVPRLADQEERRRGKKRSTSLLSPMSPPAKRAKTIHVTDGACARTVPRPADQEERRRGKKQSTSLLSTMSPPAKRVKTMKTEDDKDPVHLEPQAGPSSFSGSTGMPAEAASVQATGVTTHRRVLGRDTTYDLHRMLGEFLCRRCHRIQDLAWTEPVFWLLSVDRHLYRTLWHRRHFLCRGSLVFLYMVCEDSISAQIASRRELKAVLLTCLYVSCAYVGHSISYPAMPFIVESNRMAFWRRVLGITSRLSAKMLQINNNPQYFAMVFSDLKNTEDR